MKDHDFEWDDEKAARNLARHGVSFEAARLAMDDIRRASPKAKVLNRDRVRFEVGGGNYRLIASFDFRRQIVFVKFVGTHAEYDAIDALTVARF